MALINGGSKYTLLIKIITSLLKASLNIGICQVSKLNCLIWNSCSTLYLNYITLKHLQNLVNPLNSGVTQQALYS